MLTKLLGTHQEKEALNSRRQTTQVITGKLYQQPLPRLCSLLGTGLCVAATILPLTYPLDKAHRVRRASHIPMLGKYVM